ncbi:unnamed protein product [Cunninghamella echinulata]
MTSQDDNAQYKDTSISIDTSSTTTSATQEPEATAKNIANIYSRLQSVMNKTQSEYINPEAKFIPLPPSLPLSPTCSSPGLSQQPSPYNTKPDTAIITPPLLPTSVIIKPNNNNNTTTSGTITTTTNNNNNNNNDNIASINIKEADDTHCPCHHILISKDSKHCGLCDREIPVMEALFKERDTHEHEIRLLQRRLAVEQIRIQEQSNDIALLQASVRDVEKELNTKTTAFEALKNDMELLNEKYVDEIERVAEIQHSKDMVENELEDLSRRLFEEANGMVANEKREKHNLEIAHKHLENQLAETRERLVAEQMQLKELRLKMQEMQEIQQQQPSSSLSSSLLDTDHHHQKSNRTSVDGKTINSINSGIEKGSEDRGLKDLAGLLPQHQSDNSSRHSSDSDNTSQNDPWSDMDDMLLNEFAEFVKFGTSMPLKKLHSIPFMKHCQLEDVDPCLRFGAHSRLSARKINDAIVMNTCFIEESPAGFADEQARRPVDLPLKISAAKSMIWERFSSSSQNTIFSGCQACGRSNDSPLPYRFRISYFDDWACIDRYCRDRLVAVCEFYVFIRNVRQGYYSSRSMFDLYQEAMRLRLQMFYARMGALTWTIRSLGVKGDIIGTATSPKLDIPEPPVSESSPLPRTIAAKDHDVNKRSGSMEELSVAETNPAVKGEPQPTNDKQEIEPIASNEMKDEDDTVKKDEKKDDDDDDNCESDAKENADDVFMDAKDEHNDK